MDQTPCLSLTPSLHVPTGGMVLQCYIDELYQNVPASFSVAKIEQKTNTSHRHLYTFTITSLNLRDEIKKYGRSIVAK